MLEKLHVVDAKKPSPLNTSFNAPNVNALQMQTSALDSAEQSAVSSCSFSCRVKTDHLIDQNSGSAASSVMRGIYSATDMVNNINNNFANYSFGNGSGNAAQDVNYIDPAALGLSLDNAPQGDAEDWTDAKW